MDYPQIRQNPNFDIKAQRVSEEVFGIAPTRGKYVPYCCFRKWYLVDAAHNLLYAATGYRRHGPHTPYNG